MLRVNSTKLLVSDVVETTETTKSGIILPNAVIKQDSMRGIVVVVGEGTPDIKMNYTVGETVLFHPRAGSKFHYEDKEYRLVDCNEIFLSGLD